MKEIQKISLFLFLGMLALSILSEPACRKKDTAPTAVVLVLDSIHKTPVPNATVSLQLNNVLNPTTKLPAQKPDPSYKITDATGEVTFTLKYEASYNADVSRTGYKTKTNAALVRFKKNTTTRDTVLLAH